MGKDLNNTVEVLDGNIQNAIDALNEGKTVIIAVEKGPLVQGGLEQGYSEYMQAHMELKEDKENAGICGCQKPANALVYLWRD